MTKFVDSLGLKRLVQKIAEAVGKGTWLPVKKGEGEGAVVIGSDNNVASGNYSHAEGYNTTAKRIYSHAEGSHTTASGNSSHAEGSYTTANGDYSHAEGHDTTASGINSHAEGSHTTASGDSSHAEGYKTTVSGIGSHAEGTGNYNDSSFISMVGVGNDFANYNRRNAVAIYVKRDQHGEAVPYGEKKWLPVSTWCWRLSR